ncbi:unnamed protein product [Closterium sp. NIES-64]|nr:unnamed protein product [Closterium sp. NIES-64]
MLMKEEMASGVDERVAALEAKLREQGDAMAAMQRDMADMRRTMAAEVESTKGRINDLEAELAAFKDGRAEKSRDEREESSAGKRRKREESPGKEVEMALAAEGGEVAGEGGIAGAAADAEPKLTVGGSAAEGKGDEAESESEEEWGANGEEDFDGEAELQELCDRVVALEKRTAVEELRKAVGGKTWEALLTLWSKVSPNETRMDISDDYLTDAALSQLASFRSLTSLDLSGSSGFTAERVTQFFCLTGLTFLNLAQTNATDASLEGVTDSSMKHLRNLTRLEKLELWNARITAAGVKWLNGLNSLKVIGTEAEDVEGLIRDGLPGMIVTDSTILE